MFLKFISKQPCQSTNNYILFVHHLFSFNTFYGGSKIKFGFDLNFYKEIKIMNCNYKNSDSKKPLLLSTQKWSSILNQLHKNDIGLQQTEQEKKYLQYLKDGSNEMSRKWSNAINKGEFYVPPVDNRKIKLQEKALEDQKQFEKIKENDEKVRKEKIAKAQQMIQRLQPGPRDLESAAMLSEVLKAREIQNDLKNKFNESQYAATIYDNEVISSHTTPWIELEQKRIVLNQNRNDEYKSELFNCIKTQRKNKIECLKALTEGEQKIREQIDRDVRAQIERERATLQRKKEIMRKNALEAMKMVEQRRLREKMENNVDDSINMIYSQGKQEISQMRKDMQKQLMLNKLAANDENGKKLIAVDNQKEEESYKKASQELLAKLDAQEMEKIKKDKEIKAAKIKYYIEESQRQKVEKQQKIEEFKWSVANRLKNDEVNKEFEMRKHEEKVKKAQEVRCELINQVKERKANEKLEKSIDIKCNTFSYDDKDQFFFNYANKLMDDAKNKSRPILPFIKAIGNYKKLNNLEAETYVPPHLVSNVPINNDKCDMKLIGKPVIKYNLCELKQLNPSI